MCSLQIVRKVVLSLVFIASLLFGYTEKIQARNRVILTNTKSINSQIRSTDKGAIYIIQQNIDLKNNTIKLPQDALMKFEGGLLSNGELVGNNTTIEAGRYQILSSVSLSGSWTIDGIPVEWFGAIPNRSDYDCAKAINQAIMSGKRISAPATMGSGIYYTKSTIDIPENGTVIGLSPTLTSICYKASIGVGVYMHGQYPTLKNICVQEYKMERNGVCIKMGDLKTKVSCTRGYVEDVKTIGGNQGLAMEFQWCNKISGVNCRYNNIGLYANATTPYVENAVIEGNYEYGIYSEGFGIKLYNVIVEGNRIGCVLNGRDNLLNNCYFEGNTASLLNAKAKKNSSGVDIEGGHLYVGEDAAVNSLVLIGCLIDGSRKYNNTIRIDKCQSFSAIGCNSMKQFILTKNCKVKYVDQNVEK